VATTNTVPTGFWLACFILSNNRLLVEIRAEIKNIVARTVVEGKETFEYGYFAKICLLIVSGGLPPHCQRLFRPHGNARHASQRHIPPQKRALPSKFLPA
jgi:hypothetical protein